MAVDEILKHREFEFDDLTQELKKLNCTIPVEPDHTCQEKCKEIKSQLGKNNDRIKKLQDNVTKYCEVKSRRLQAPAPQNEETKEAHETAEEAQKPSPVLDDCSRAKNQYNFKKFLVDTFETYAKSCTCDKPEPPKPEPTCDEKLAKNKEVLKKQSEKLKKLTTEYEKDCKAKDGKRRLQAPTKPDPCDAKKKELETLTKETNDLLEKTKKLPCYEPIKPTPPPDNKTCEELLLQQTSVSERVTILKLTSESCSKKRRLQAPTPVEPEEPVKPEQPTEEE